MNNLEARHKLSPEDVAIVVAARNEAENIRSCVDSILKASKGRSEIWFVDDASTDSTRTILQEYGNQIHILYGAGQGPGKARNQAIGQTKKKYIAFTDADCVVREDWLERMCEAFNDEPKTTSSVGGIQRIWAGAKWVERTIGRFFEAIGFVSDYVHVEEKRYVLHNPTCNVLYSVEALQEVKNFDETLWPCEDLDLDLRLKKVGYRALFDPKIQVEHRRPDQFAGLVRMMHRYGEAHAMLVRKHGLCQPIHVLPILVPLCLLFPVWMPSLPVLVLVSIFVLTIRSKSLADGILFSLLLGIVIFSWVIGFYTRLLRHG